MNIDYEFKECLINDQSELINEFNPTLNERIGEANELNCFNLIKICDQVLLYVESEDAKKDEYSLLAIQAFIQKLTYLMKTHSDQSKINKLFIITMLYFFKLSILK